MMLLYMVRHGESEANERHTHAGWGQVRLTAKGREDAKKAKALLCDLSFDKVYVSDLIRAVETAAIALPDYEAEQTPLLREIGVGELSGKTAEQCAEIFGEAYWENKKIMNYAVYGGESAAEHRGRVAEFLKSLEDKPFERVAAVCHAGSIHRVVEVAAGGKDLVRRPCSNGGVFIFEYKDGTWSLKEWDVGAKEDDPL